MLISIMDTNDLTATDRACLRALLDTTVEHETETVTAVEAAPAEAPRRGRPRKTAEPAPADPVEDGGPSLADAIAAATELVATGGTAKVKAALETAGVKRVSELNSTDVVAFIAALDQ